MAALNRDSFQDEIADITECSICADIFTEPKVLPCVHTFCLRCLEKYGKEKNPGDQMVCPLCRKEFLIPDGGFSHLPSNFFIGKMVEIGKLAMTPTNEMVCTLCPKDIAVMAQMFCVDCDENLCASCESIHKKCCQHHQVVELGSQLNARELNLRNCYCDHHPGEMIKMFCYEDKVAICLICCVESHQSHRCVNVNKAAGEFVEQLKCSSAKVKGRLLESREIGEILDRFKKEFMAQALKTEEGIFDAANKVTKLIQQHSERLVHQVKSVADRNSKAFESIKLDVDLFRVMIESYSNYSEKLLTQGSSVDICRAVDQMLTRAQELATLPANCSGESFCSETVTFNPSDILNTLKAYGLTNAVGELSVAPSSDWLLKFNCKTSECLDEIPVAGPCEIEVQGIPDNATEAVVTMIFENKRCSGVEDVDVAQFLMLERGRAILTLKEPQHAKALIEKGSITYKSHTLVISKPEPIKELTETVQHRFSNVVTEPPVGNASGHEELVSDGASIDVANIPEDIDESFLHMMFESKRFGGGEVKNIIYDKIQGSAVITLSDPEVAKRLVSQKWVVFKDTRLMVTKHIEEDRSQKSFPARKLINVPTEVKEQTSLTDRTIKVTNIPSIVNEETLEMIFENRRNSGGETENIVYDQRKGTALITFKDPEVAMTLLRKEVLVYRGNQFAITAAVEEPVEGSKQDQASFLSGRMVDVSDFPSAVTTEVLTLLLENSSGGDIENIDRDWDRNTAVATFSKSSDVDVLISKGSVVYKGKRLSIAKHVEKVDRQRIPKEKKETSVSSNRTISVSQIPENMNKDYLTMFFENKRSGGGKIEQVDYDQEQRTAVITFEDPNVAASFLEKKIVDFKGQHILVTKHENQSADEESDDDNDNNVSGKESLDPKYTVSGSFNTVKVSGIPKDTSEDMIAMYFENKRRSGGGRLRVIEYQKERGKAVIKFDDPEDAVEVRKRIQVFCGAIVKICALEMPLDDVKSCAIEVKGLPAGISQDLLVKYFENTSRSGGGGGPVENLFVDRDARTVLIVFEEATAVLGVMKKQPHKLDGATVEVNVLEPAPPPPLLLSDVDTRKLLAKRLPPSVTRDSLNKYLSPAVKAKMVGWTTAVKPGRVLLDFSSEPDYLSIRRLVCSKPFLGKMISIRRVPLTSSILVTGIPSSISVEFLAMYFENPRNGGTGDDCKVEMLPGNSSAIVKLKRPDVIRAVTSRRHVFEKKEVKVEPYYPCLGLKITGELEKELERKQKRISETVTTLKPHQLALVKTEEFKRRLKQATPDLEFEVKQTEVYLCGMPDVVKKARLLILETVTATVQESFETTEAMIKVFAKEQAKLIEELRSKGISASWTYNDRGVTVYAVNEKHLKESVFLLKNEVVERRLQLRALNLRRGLFLSQGWKDFIERLHWEENMSSEVSVKESVLIVACMRKSFENAKKRIEIFLDKNKPFPSLFSSNDNIYRWE